MGESYRLSNTFDTLVGNQGRVLKLEITVYFKSLIFIENTSEPFHHHFQRRVCNKGMLLSGIWFQMQPLNRHQFPQRTEKICYLNLLSNMTLKMKLHFQRISFCNLVCTSYEQSFQRGKWTTRCFLLGDPKRVRNYATNCSARGWKMTEITTETQESSQSASF